MCSIFVLVLSARRCVHLGAAGGWGKPPVDEDGNPIYGDVFGQHLDEDDEYEQQVGKGGAQPSNLVKFLILSDFL